MFTKLGDDFGAQLLERDREKHIQDIVTMFFLWTVRPRKIIVSKEQIKSTKSPLIFKSQGLFHVK